MIPVPRLLAVVCLLLTPLPSWVSAQTEADNTLLKRGEYVFKISGCANCHTAENGVPLAGGRPLVTPFWYLLFPEYNFTQNCGYRCVEC